MKIKLIQIKHYLLLIDEEAEIKLNDYVYEYMKGEHATPISIVRCTEEDLITLEVGELDSINVKVLAYFPLTNEASQLDLPLLPNPFKKEVDVEDIIKDCFGTNNNSKILLHELTHDDLRTLAKNGYNHGKAQAKQFSLEDMMKAYTQGSNDSYDSCYINNTNPCGVEVVEINQNEFDRLTEKYFQSLPDSQLPKEFVPEYETVGQCNCICHKEGVVAMHMIACCHPRMVLRTKTNSEGNEEVIGEYL